MFILSFIVSGLNYRFEWFIFPKWIVAISTIIFILGYLLYPFLFCKYSIFSPNYTSFKIYIIYSYLKLASFSPNISYKKINYSRYFSILYSLSFTNCLLLNY